MEYVTLQHNFSKAIRQIDLGGKAILKDIGDTIAMVIWEEFEQLVMETSQYSGTTAASWRISMQNRVGAFQGGLEDYDEQPAPASRAEAFQRGHAETANKSLSNASNQDALASISTAYARQEITITNNAPGADTAEYGPARKDSTNEPGAFQAFQERIASASAPVIHSRVI